MEGLIPGGGGGGGWAYKCNEAFRNEPLTMSHILIEI